MPRVSRGNNSGLWDGRACVLEWLSTSSSKRPEPVASSASGFVMVASTCVWRLCTLVLLGAGLGCTLVFSATVCCPLERNCSRDGAVLRGLSRPPKLLILPMPERRKSRDAAVRSFGGFSSPPPKPSLDGLDRSEGVVEVARAG